MQVVQVVGAAAGAGDAVVHLEQLEREIALAAVAQPLLLAEQDVLVPAVGNGRLDVGAARDVGAGVQSPAYPARTPVIILRLA